MALPTLPDELWLEIIWYAGFDDVWKLESADNNNYGNGGDPWLFIGPEEVFEEIFQRTIDANETGH